MEERNFLENLIHKTSSYLAKIIDFHEIELGDYIKNKNSLRYRILTSEKIFFLLLSCTSIAIDQDIFQKKKHWELVKSHLRDFRNYIHIEKEVNNEEIDQHWFEIIEPVFDVLFEQFKQN